MATATTGTSISVPKPAGTVVLPKPPAANNAPSVSAKAETEPSKPKVPPPPPPPPIGHLVQPFIIKLVWLFALLAAGLSGFNAHDNGADGMDIMLRSTASAAAVAWFGTCILRPLFFSMKYDLDPEAVNGRKAPGTPRPGT